MFLYRTKQGFVKPFFVLFTFPFALLVNKALLYLPFALQSKGTKDKVETLAKGK
jgi:hypothetical protein